MAPTPKTPALKSKGSDGGNRRNPPLGGPYPPEPPPGTGKYPLPPQFPRPKGIPGGGEGGKGPKGFPKPKGLPSVASLLRGGLK